MLVGMLMFLILPALPLPTVAMPTAFYGILMCIIFFSLSMLFVHLEKSSLSSVNLIPDAKTLFRLGLGFVIGAAIAGCMLLAVFALTNVTISVSTEQTLTSFLIASLVIIPMALMEELLFRGYPFFRLLSHLHIRWVILITSILFALYHLNETSSLWSVLLGPGVWGVIFGVAAYLTQSIAVPVGIHIAANFMQAIFDMNKNVEPLWNIALIEDSTRFIMDVETLGVSMQILLLIGAIIVLERSIAKRMRNLVDD